MPPVWEVSFDEWNWIYFTRHWLSSEIKKNKITEVWAEDNPLGLATHQPPIVQLISSAELIWVQQYPISLKAKKGIAVYIDELQESGFLIPYWSAWDTPLLPVQKPRTSDYRSVQDLRKFNKWLRSFTPQCLTHTRFLPPTHQMYFILDLKDAFFSLPLAAVSQSNFSSEWTQKIRKGFFWENWHGWDCHRGFKILPHYLSQDLTHFRQQHPEVVLLQYVDDLLLAAKTEAECFEAAEVLLQELVGLGYHISVHKAQPCTSTATDLEHELREGRRSLSSSCIKAILKYLNQKQNVRLGSS